MNIKDSIIDTRRALDNLVKTVEFKRDKKDEKTETRFQIEVGKCRGKLESTKVDLNNNIFRISGLIQEADRQHLPTQNLEDMLWDSAIGYMLVKQALFTIHTYGSYSSVQDAYAMMDTASKEFSRTGLKISKGSVLAGFGFGSKKSDVDISDIEAKINAIFDELMVTGDIEECLDHYYNKVPVPGPVPRPVPGPDPAARPQNDYKGQLDDLEKRLKQNNE